MDTQEFKRDESWTNSNTDNDKQAERTIDNTEHQIKQREQQANELVTEQQKALAGSKGFGFGR